MLTVERSILKHASCVLFNFSHSGTVYRGYLNDFGGSYHSNSYGFQSPILGEQEVTGVLEGQ